MGTGAWSSRDWDKYAKARGFTDRSTARDMYRAVTVNPLMEPRNVAFREARDSAEHPNSTPVILGLDVTGSMGGVLETISKKLNVLITEIYSRRPIVDPQIMVMAFGDVECDRHPLQVTQFESDIRIAEQLNSIYFERGGGGNDGESYTLPWYFAARRTRTDQYEKRNKKGYLFTFGDEKYLPILRREAVLQFTGDSVEHDFTAQELLTEVSRQYEVYHLMIEEGAGMSRGRGSSGEDVAAQWTELLGQRAIRISDCTKLPEIIVSLLELASGKDEKEVISSWDGSTAPAVQKAVGGLYFGRENSGMIEF